MICPLFTDLIICFLRYAVYLIQLLFEIPLFPFPYFPGLFNHLQECSFELQDDQCEGDMQAGVVCYGMYKADWVSLVSM